MVERQLRRRGIEDERVLAAMSAVPREAFLPHDARRDAYRDGAVGIDEGQTMSQPWIVARMASLLELRGDETVLDVEVRSGDGTATSSTAGRRSSARCAATAASCSTAFATAPPRRSCPCASSRS